MNRFARPFGFYLTLTVLLAVGCSGSSSSSVEGTVTVDGQPLKDGAVSFIPIDPKAGGTSGAVVKDGKFTAEVPLGDMRVEFSAPKVVGKKKMYDTPESPTVDIIDELLPARYNKNSELKITVKKGSQKETFALTSK